MPRVTAVARQCLSSSRGDSAEAAAVASAEEVVWLMWCGATVGAPHLLFAISAASKFKFAPAETRPLNSLHQLIADVGVFIMLRMFVVNTLTTPTS